MLVRSFYNKRLRHYAHLVVDPESRDAAVIDPVADDVDEYAAAAARDAARVTLGLQTTTRPADRTGLRAVAERFGARTCAPATGPQPPETLRVVRVGDQVEFAEGRIEVAANTPPAGPDVAYRVGDLLFTGWTLVRSQAEGPGLPSDADEIVARARRDLGALLEARKLTGKETQLAAAYLELLGRLGRPPSAKELADVREDLDRGGVHVLIHGIRRKQVALGQVPLLLEGQMHKWLRGLQGEPEYTPHERTFLAAYLAFVDAHRRVPTGPELLEQLPPDTKIQWVRKRVHTIRRKQAAFGLTPLKMGRESRQPG